MQSEWRAYLINEVCEKIVDCVNKTAQVSDHPTDYKMIRTTNIKDGWIDVDNVRCVSKEVFTKWTRRIVPQKNDIILTREAPLGEVGLVRTNDKIFLGQRTILYRANLDKVNPLFLYYTFKSELVQNQFKSFGSGSTVEHIRIEDCETFKVTLPQLSTQNKIASILSAYDDLIEVNNQRIKLLEETARELYKEWFVRMRFPGYKDSQFIKGIPKNWEIKKLGEIMELVYGKALKEENRTDGPYLVYGSSGAIGSHNAFIAKAPGIVVGRKGNVGSVFWVTKNFYPIDTAFYIKTKVSLYYSFFNLKEQHFIEGDAAVPGLSRNQVYGNFILKPDSNIQKEFDDVIKPLFDLKVNLEDQNIQLREIRDKLLPRLISGKLEVRTVAPAVKVIKMKPTHGVSMVAEEDAGYVKAKKPNLFFQRRVLAAYIIDRLKDELTFGHVKLMKLMYLCEHLAEIETASHYHRDAAGPYDNKMIRSIDSQLKKAQWFECKLTDKKYTYTPLAKKDEYKAWFSKYYGDKETGIESLLQIFGKEKTEKAEMVATLYEAHRDLKERKQIASDDAVINEVLNNWHESKKRIDEKRWRERLADMKEKGWIS